MKVRNEASFRAFRKTPRFRVIVSDNTMLLAENLGQAMDQAEALRRFGKAAVIKPVEAKAR